MSAIVAGLLVSAFGMFSGATLDRSTTPNIAQAVCEDDWCDRIYFAYKCRNGLEDYGCNQNGDECVTYECNGS